MKTFQFSTVFVKQHIQHTRKINSLSNNVSKRLMKSHILKKNNIKNGCKYAFPEWNREIMARHSRNEVKYYLIPARRFRNETPKYWRGVSGMKQWNNGEAFPEWNTTILARCSRNTSPNCAILRSFRNFQHFLRNSWRGVSGMTNLQKYWHADRSLSQISGQVKLRNGEVFPEHLSKK